MANDEGNLIAEEVTQPLYRSFRLPMWQNTRRIER